MVFYHTTFVYRTYVLLYLFIFLSGSLNGNGNTLCTKKIWLFENHLLQSS